MNEPVSHYLQDALGWALESSTNPARAAADWLARDIDPDCPTAVELVTREDSTLEQLNLAKSAFKTMRVLGETSSDRRVGAWLYIGTIASALVHHGERITKQSDAALRRAFLKLYHEESVGTTYAPLFALAGRALDAMDARSGPGA